jgi:hypothetical protein
VAGIESKVKAEIPSVISDNDDQFLVQDSKKNQFYVSTGAELLEAMRFKQDYEDHSDDAVPFMQILADWKKRYNDRFLDLIINIGDGSLNLFIIQKSEQYDEELHDAVVDLEVALFNSTGHGDFDIDCMVLPNMSKDNLSAFIY